MEKRLCIFLGIIAGMTGITFLAQYIAVMFFTPANTNGYIVIPPHMVDKAMQSLVIGVIMAGLALFFTFIAFRRRY